MQIIDNTIEYDNQGRMRTHPVYHPNAGTPWNKEDLIYLCKYWEFDNRVDIAFALGRNESSCAAKVGYLKNTGMFEFYKQYEGDWE